MKTYYYIPNIREDDELDLEDAYEFESNRDINSHDPLDSYDEYELRWLVEEMASDYVRNHDGWEISDNWCGTCRDFAIWDENKNFIGTFEVLLEYSPDFTAWRK